MKNIPFYKTSLKIDSNIEKSVTSGWITTGPMVKKFENQLAEYLGVKHVIAVNSCTAALHLSLAAQELQPNDYVIVPNITFVATSEVVEYFGAKVILCDINPQTLCIDTEEVESILKKMKGKVKFVIPVHFGGYAADMISLTSLSLKYHFKIIEDCAHALETTSNIGKVGNADHCAAFSFYANKNITTGGEGGAVSTNNEVLAKRIRKLSLHGMSKDAWDRFTDSKKWYYEVDELGYKYNLTDIAAGFGVQQLRKVNIFQKRRQEISKKYDKIIDSIVGINRFFYDKKYKNARHLYIIHIDQKYWSITRDDLIIKLNNLGIGTSVHYIPLHRMPYYKNKYALEDKNFPNSCNYFEGCISLPIYPSLSDKDIDYIDENLNSLYREYKK